MYQTLQSAIQDVNIIEDREKRLKVLIKIVEATELALINSAGSTGVEKYQINTGQSVISVAQSKFETLLKSFIRLKALLREVYGVSTGDNIMTFRDAQSNQVGFGEMI